MDLYSRWQIDLFRVIRVVYVLFPAGHFYVLFPCSSFSTFWPFSRTERRTAIRLVSSFLQRRLWWPSANDSHGFDIRPLTGSIFVSGRMQGHSRQADNDFIALATTSNLPQCVLVLLGINASEKAKTFIIICVEQLIWVLNKNRRGHWLNKPMSAGKATNFGLKRSILVRGAGWNKHCSGVRFRRRQWMWRGTLRQMPTWMRYVVLLFLGRTSTICTLYNPIGGDVTSWWYEYDIPSGIHWL